MPFPDSTQTQTESPLFLLIAAGIWVGSHHSKFEPGVAQEFRVYGSVLVGGSALTLFWSVIPDSVVKAHHHTLSTMRAGTWSNLIDVALDSLFAFIVHRVFLESRLRRCWGGSADSFIPWRAQSDTSSPRTCSGGPWGADPHRYRAIPAQAAPSGPTIALTASETAIVSSFLAGGADATACIAAFAVYYRSHALHPQPVHRDRGCDASVRRAVALSG